MRQSLLIKLLLSFVLLLSSSGLWAKETQQKPILMTPFERMGNYILLRVQINGSKPLSFLLDTGAAGSFIDKSRATQLGLTLEGSEVGMVVNGFAEATFAHNVTLKLADANIDFPLRFPVIGAIDLNGFKAAVGRDIDGVIGGDLLKLFVAEIDYAPRILKLYDPSLYQHRGSGDSIPFVVEENVPYVNIKVTTKQGNSYDCKVCLDSGADSALILNKAFMDKSHIVEQSGKTFSASSTQFKNPLQASRLQKIQIGRFQSKNPIAFFSQATEGALATAGQDGLIGGELLHRFKWTLDYSRGKLFLEPNKHFSEAYKGP